MWTMGPALEFEVHAPLYMPPHPRQGLSPLRTSMSLSVKLSIFFAGTETHTRGSEARWPGFASQLCWKGCVTWGP